MSILNLIRPITSLTFYNFIDTNIKKIETNKTSVKTKWLSVQKKYLNFYRMIGKILLKLQKTYV